MNYTKKAHSIIADLWYLTLATASRAGEPWSTPVYFSYDESFNFFWGSWTGTQHSQNIRENPSVFISIFNSSLPIGGGEGVYIKARARELDTEGEVLHAIKYHYGRKKSEPRGVGEFLGDMPRRFYKAIPEKVWINLDSEMKGSHIDTRKEITL